jgi:hypothetical protein
MPLSGLPKLLEMFMEQTLNEHQVSSWNIRGGNIYTEITIRIGMSTVTKDTVKYRKVPPSRINRDKQRATRSSSIFVKDMDMEVQVDGSHSDEYSESVGASIHYNFDGVQAI